MVRKGGNAVINQKISVLMSVYNEPLIYVQKALESIREQSYKNLEIIVIVDKPDYKEAVTYLNDMQKVDQRIDYHVNSTNIGLAMSLNRALSYATGSYLARMDADDIAKGDRLEKELNYIEQKQLDVVGSWADVIDENNAVWNEISGTYFTQEAVTQLLPIQNVLIHPTVLMRTDMVKKVGGYRNFASCQDYDLWLRLLSANYKIGIINEKLLFFRRHKNSITATRRYNQILNEMYIQELYRQRLKHGKDDFSEAHLNDYLSRNGYKDSENVKRQNELLAHYQTGKKEIAQRNIVAGVKDLAVSLSSSAVRHSIKVSAKAKMIKQRLNRGTKQ
mgnify:FL=1